MGRTNPTFRDLLRGLEDEWSEFRRCLRTPVQSTFDQLFEHARKHADAAGYLNPPFAEIPVLLSIDLEQERRITELETQIDELEAELEELRSDPTD